MSKIAGAIIALVLAAAGAAYLGIGYVIYDRLSAVQPGCPRHISNTPAAFAVHHDRFSTFDTTPYQIAAYEDVTFPSRAPGITLAGWYAEVDPAAPTVILTHGLNACKHDHVILIAAGMLYHAGFNVLMFDLRDQGASTVEDGRTAIGNEEYLDLLGAWDWVITARGAAPERVGLYGTSLGAATTLAAFAEEPRAAAAFVDSPYADLTVVITEELARNNYPTFLMPAGLLAARVVAGDDLLAHSPMDAVRQHEGRPLFIVHGDADKRVDQHHTHDLAALAAQTGADLTTWLPAGVGHVEAMLYTPAEYEQRLTAFFTAALAP